MSDLPVDRARLKRQFPELTDADLEAYETITLRILEKKAPAERAKLTRDVMETARTARTKASAGSELTERERQALRYLDAVDKMQGTTVKKT
jgi:peptide subunit release factor 1 (eRF1)